MKTLIAFVGGVVLAGTVAFVALRKDVPSEPVQEVAQVQPPATNVAPPTPAEPAVEPAPPPAVVAPPAAVTPREDKPVKRVPRSPQPAVKEPVKEEPSPAAPAPAVAPSAPPVAPPAPPQTVTPPAVPEEPKPAFTPLKPKDPPKPPEPNKVTVAGGTTLAVRLRETLDSSKLEQGQTFQATLDQPLIVDGFVIAERGAAVEGRVRETQQAGRVKGLSHLSIELMRFTTSDGQRIPIRTAVWEKEGEKDTKGDATKVAVGAGIGAAIGAIFGGGKGAAIGAGSGGAAGAGTVLATRGKPVVLPAETRLSFRLEGPVTIIERR